MINFTGGIAFICEGSTEKIFYNIYFKKMAIKNKCTFQRCDSINDGNINYEWINGNKRLLIKFNVVGAITQVTNSATWYLNKCAKKYKIPWIVCLCYDTDSSSKDISKFYEGDWEILRTALKARNTREIIDLAASADIEDIMLYDLDGVCRFLGRRKPKKLIGRKGKAKMKNLYSECNKTYHEGERAKEMIETLDFQKIIMFSPLPFDKLEKIL